MLNDAQSTIAGLKAQDCPGGGWNGMPAELEGKATVADCVANGGCGCIYGNAVEHIESQRAALVEAEAALACCYQVTDYPADGNSDQDRALAHVRIVLAAGDQQPHPSMAQPGLQPPPNPTAAKDRNSGQPD